MSSLKQTNNINNKKNVFVFVMSGHRNKHGSTILLNSTDADTCMTRHVLHTACMHACMHTYIHKQSGLSSSPLLQAC